MKYVVDQDACISCWACIGECDMAAITGIDDVAFITDSCTGCGRCVDACPRDAIQPA